MKAALLRSPRPASARPLEITEIAKPDPPPDSVLLKVRACGVCRTDLHIVEGELHLPRLPLIPGHQIVGEVADNATQDLPIGKRVGVSWLGGTDGSCRYCAAGDENLCDAPAFTGYTVDGGFAEYAFARSDFVYPLPDSLDDLQAAPLLCAGIIGFRSLRVAGVRKGERVGLFGFGASAHLALPVLRSWNCEVYVVTRGESHRMLAESLGAVWVGTEMCDHIRTQRRCCRVCLGQSAKRWSRCDQRNSP
jgi:alcohol dehydrogenase, propanol-preferring